MVLNQSSLLIGRDLGGCIRLHQVALGDATNFLSTCGNLDGRLHQLHQKPLLKKISISSSYSSCHHAGGRRPESDATDATVGLSL